MNKIKKQEKKNKTRKQNGGHNFTLLILPLLFPKFSKKVKKFLNRTHKKIRIRNNKTKYLK
tara:strand:- start:843 stop:1025 length:183 start_codon:yes stop_codon:yes gene_type:complete